MIKMKKILLSLRHRPAHLLGIDIRQNFIRLVELSYCYGKYQIESYANIILDKPIVSDEMVILAVKKVMKEALPKTKLVAIALALAGVIFKEISVASDLSLKEIDDFLFFNLSEYVEGDKDKIGFGYQIIERGADSDSTTKLQLVIVEKERIEKLNRLFKEGGLTPKIIDVDIYALERAIRYQEKNIQGLIAAVNLDYGHILTVVLDAKKIVYVHENFVGEKNLESMAQTLKQIEAELQLIYSSISEPLKQLILGGEKALMTGLVEAVGSTFNISTIVANPFLGMKLSSSIAQESIDKISPMMLVSCGLALRVGPNDGY